MRKLHRIALVLSIALFVLRCSGADRGTDVSSETASQTGPTDRIEASKNASSGNPSAESKSESTEDSGPTFQTRSQALSSEPNFAPDYGALRVKEPHNDVSFDGGFDNTPLVFTQVQTAHDNGVSRTSQVINTTKNGVTIEFCEQEGDKNCGLHGQEKIAWWAIDPLRSKPTNLDWGTVSSADGGWRTISYGFSKAPAVIATVQTENGGDESLYAEVRNVTSSSAQVRVCEAVPPNDCGPHNAETVAWLAISRGSFSIEGTSVGDAGHETNLNNSEWQNVSPFNYNDAPHVFATTQTTNGQENPSAAHVRNITQDDFETQHCEWEGGDDCDGHAEETNGWATLKSNALSSVGNMESGSYLTGNRDNTRDVEFGDFDADGDADAFVVHEGSQPAKVLKNDGDGNFIETNQTLGSADSYGVALGDINRDGDVDAIVANKGGQSNQVWMNQGSGNLNFSNGQSFGSNDSRDISLADFDSDGDLDALVGNKNQANILWKNNGNGLFGSSNTLGGANTRGVAAGDMNGDGHTDVVSANAGGAGNNVWINDGASTPNFSKKASLGNSDTRDVALEDFDSDGDLEILAVNKGANGDANEIWVNQRSNSYSDRESLGNYETHSAVVGDLNADGAPDILTLNGDGQANRVWFSDGDTSFSFSTSSRSLGESNSTAAALGDVDADGDLDALVANADGEANRLWNNQLAPRPGNRKYVETQSMGSGASQDVELGDLDWDGDLDAFVTNRASQANKVWENNSSGSFSLATTTAGYDTYGLSLGDLNRDGLPDVMAGVAFDQNRVYTNDGPGNLSFTESQSLGIRTTIDIALGDFDADGDLDAFSANSRTSENRVWLNDGSGSFSASGQNWQTNSSSVGVDVADLDKDGDLDAFVVNKNGTPNRIYRNDGSGTFNYSGNSAHTLGNADSRRVSLADLDRDGDIDAYVANANNDQNRIWLNNGQGNAYFTAGDGMGGSNSKDVGLADIDRDGDLDAYIANYNQPNKIWLNNGSAQFSDKGEQLGSGKSLAVALANLDGDSDFDAYVANRGEPNHVWFYNNPPSAEFTYRPSPKPKADTLVDLDATDSVDRDSSIASYDWKIKGPSGNTLTKSGQNTEFKPNEVGDWEVELTVTDDRNASNTKTRTITVKASLTANDDSQSTDNGLKTSEESTTKSNNSILDNDKDPEGQSLHVDSVSNDSNSVVPGNKLDGRNGGVFEIDGDGNVSFEPNGDFESLSVGDSKTTSVDYTAEDGHGESDTATVTVTVTGANDPPTASDDSSATDAGLETNEDSETSSSNTILSNDSDPDTNDTLAIDSIGNGSLNVKPGNSIEGQNGGSFTIDSDGNVSFDPKSDFQSLISGSFKKTSVDYTATDGNGGTASATVTVKVNGRNDPIKANDDSPATDTGLQTDEDSSTRSSKSILDNDSAPDQNDNLSLQTLSNGSTTVGPGSSIDGKSGGTFTVDSAGHVSFSTGDQFQQLAKGESTTTSINYTISDGHGNDASGSITVKITGKNDAPVAQDDNQTSDSKLKTDEETAITSNKSILSNDSDVDGSDTLAIDGVTNGNKTVELGTGIEGKNGGTFTVKSNGKVSFKPGDAFQSLGVDQSETTSIDYTVKDGNGGTDTASVIVTVTGKNDSPKAKEDNQSTDPGLETTEGSSSVSGKSALQNDTDPDRTDDLFVKTVSNGSKSVEPGSSIEGKDGGSFTVERDGTVIFDANGDFQSLAAGKSKTTSVKYTVADGNGGTAEASIIVQVSGNNDAPTATDDSKATDSGLETTEGSTTSSQKSVLQNDSDPDEGDELKIDEITKGAKTVSPGSSIQGTRGGQFIIDKEGKVSFDPAGKFKSLGADETKTTAVEYKISDSSNSTDKATISVTVNGKENAPKDDDDSDAECEVNADCDTGEQVCVDGQCTTPKSCPEAPCAEGKKCVEGTCKPEDDDTNQTSEKQPGSGGGCGCDTNGRTPSNGPMPLFGLALLLGGIVSVRRKRRD